MNALIADNKVETLRRYLLSELQAFYEERESSNIVFALFEEYLGWSRSELILHAAKALSESEILKLHFALKKLKQGVPLHYVTGKAWFMGRPFIVNENVLIPRPETEELTHLILKESFSVSRILDIGTGSGCIAISIAAAWPNARVTAVDVSADALALARCNAEALGAEVRFLEMNYLDAPTFTEQFDVIVSNPPYIPQHEAAWMKTQVRDFEPHLALFVPDHDPLLFYRHILQRSEIQLAPGGHIYFEIHENLHTELEALVRSVGQFSSVTYEDMQGKKRFMICSKHI